MNARAMKLLFAIKGLHQAAGGAERVICDVSSHLAERRGHDVTVLSFDRPGATPFYALSPAVRLVQLGIGDTRSSTSLAALFRRIIALRRAVRMEAPDVVVAFMHSMFIPMAFALAGTGIPVVASEHIVRDYYRSRRIQFALFIAVAPLVRRITILSDLIASQYPASIRRKMVAVINPISPVFQRETQSRRSGDPRRVLSIGRFSERKDHATLLAAFASLAAEFPEWTLRIVGDGALRPTLQREVRRMGLENRVSLPGNVSNVEEELAQSSFFALASRYESFGLVLAEAMACGRASVAFADCPGANEVLEDGTTGLLVRGSDRVEAMAGGLRRLMTDEARRNEMGDLARRLVFQRYSIDRVCDRWEEILREALTPSEAIRDVRSP